MGAFIIDLISCLPAQAFEVLLVAVSTQAAESNTNKTARILRLNRLPKLAKIVRVLRLTKVFRFLRSSMFMRRVMSFRGTREIGLFFGFMTVSHLMACGWYLVASLHNSENLHKTWIWRREIVDSSPSE